MFMSSKRLAKVQNATPEERATWLTAEEVVKWLRAELDF
jgi:hypothetical protein